MTRKKNETCFKSLGQIVSDSSPDGNILLTSFAVHIQQIQKSPFIRYDLSPSGLISVGLPEGQALYFDTKSLHPEVVRTLVAACLHDKMVVGYDLYTSYALSYVLSQEWQPSCTLNIPTLQRVFHLANPLVEGLHAVAQLIAMTDTPDFEAAIDRLIEWDALCRGDFFTVCELMPQAMAQVFTAKLEEMTSEVTDKMPIFEKAIKLDFAKRTASLATSTKAQVLEFDLYYIFTAFDEFRLAVDSVGNSARLAWKAV